MRRLYAASRWPTIQPALFWYNTWALCNLCAEKGRIEESAWAPRASPRPGQVVHFFSAELMQVFCGVSVSSFFSRYVARKCLPAKGTTARFVEDRCSCRDEKPGIDMSVVTVQVLLCVFCCGVRCCNTIVPAVRTPTFSLWTCYVRSRA